MTQAAPTRREVLALLAILALAALIRILTADYPLWFDEIASTAFAGQPVARLWSGWMIRESNPPLYYTLLRGWITLFGGADVTLRVLSIVIGLGGIAAAWACARRLGGAFAGLAAAALIAVSAAHVDFSQEVRGYILAHSAALIALYGMIRYLDRPGLSALLIYAAGAVIALYAHTMMIIFVLIANLMMLWLVHADRKALIGWLMANAAVALLWGWWGWITLIQAQAAQSNFGWIARPGIGDAFAITESAYLPGYLASGGAGAGLLLALMVIGLGWFVWRDRRPAVVLLGVLAFAAPLALFAISLTKPVLLVRTLYWASGPVVILVAVALAGLESRRMATAALTALLLFDGAMLVHWMPARQQEDWASAMRFVGQASSHGVLLVEGDATALAATRYHALAPGVRIVALRPPPGGYDHWADGLFAGPHVDSAGVGALLRSQRRLFALVRGDHDPGRVLRASGSGRHLPDASGGRQPWVWVWSAARP